jgi:hypothetical protein
MQWRALASLALPAALLAPHAAQAAGGPHVIDDSEVETPGDCHLETWLTLSSEDARHANLGIGCTLEALPMVELGAAVSHMWAPGSDETMIGLAPKLMLQSHEEGIGVAVSGSLTYSTDRSRIESAGLIGAVTVPASPGLLINLNAGWTWSEADPASDFFAGVQAELGVGSGVTLMAEGFARDEGRAGGQAGLRWTTASGRVDIDLLAGRYLDGATPTSVTAGVTVRW